MSLEGSSTVTIRTADLDIAPGDPLPQVSGMHGPAVIISYDGVTITYRPWRWYDGPRLWFRALWLRLRALWCRVRS